MPHDVEVVPEECVEFPSKNHDGKQGHWLQKNELPSLLTKVKKFKPFKKVSSITEKINSSEKVINSQTFEFTLENVLDDASSSGDDDCSNDITKSQLQILNIEAAKLKAQRGMGNIEISKLTRLLTLLQTVIRDGSNVIPISESNENEHEKRLFVEAAMERITKAVNASLLSLQILTSAHVSSLVYLEDTIEQILVFIKYQIQNTINSVFDDGKTFKSNAHNLRRKDCKDGKEKRFVLLAQNVNDIIILLSELLNIHKLTDSLVLHVSSVGVSSFFTGSNILGLSSIVLMSNVFSKYEKHRKILMDDILTSVSNNRNNLHLYKLRPGIEIHMLTALFLQLIQSSTLLSDNTTSSKRSVSDMFMLNKYNTVTIISFSLLNEFLKKATASKSEDVNFRTIFDNFLHDLLKTFNNPKWPVAELILFILSNLLMDNLVKKNTEASLRLLSLDYLGLITARLRSYTTSQKQNIENIDNIIEKISQFDNGLETQNNNIISNTTKEDMHKIKISLELLLIYLSTQCEQDIAVLYARHFYLTIWYSDVCSKISSLESKIEIPGNKKLNDFLSQNENLNKNKTLEDLKSLKSFLKGGVAEGISQVKLREYVESDDINEIVIYLSSKRPFYQSFNIYLSFILKGLTEHSIPMRAKAMKCLSSIVEIDPTILGQKEIHVAISNSFLDQSAQVREAAVVLVGKFILGQPSLILKYYGALNNRMLDTAVSVRKRVIKILIDVCLKCPEFPKMPEVYVKIINRITDEESIISLVLDVFHKIWFTPVKEIPSFDSDSLVKKVKYMIDALMSNEANVECFEKLLNYIFKTKDKKENVCAASKQIIDCLIETIILVERKCGYHERLLSCTTLLYLISKIEPKLLVMHASTLQPYLALKCHNKIEYQILNCIARILEQIIPLIDHPSELFLSRLEEDYVKLIMQHDPAIVTTCVSSLSSTVNNLTKNYKLIKDCFNLYYGFIKKSILLIKKNNGSMEIASDIKPSLNRSLFVIGLLIQYFDFDKIEFSDDSFPKNVKAEVAENLFYLLKINWDFQQYVLRAFGSISIRYSDLMLKDELKSFYNQHLSHTESPVSLKVQILNNIESYLIEEDRKWAKEEEKWEKLSKKEDLKELSDINLGMASNIVQLYLSSILECSLHSKQAVRNAALKVIHVILTQGVIFPLSIIPYLIALSTDEDKIVRNTVEKHLREIEMKSPGYVYYKVLKGVELSYYFQDTLRDNSIVRGFRLLDNESTPKALNSYLYTILKTKQQKRSLIISLIRQIEEKAKTSPSYALYLADNLAYLPYRLQDEPLMVIYHIDVTLSVAGTNLIEMFEGYLQPDNSKMDDEEEENVNMFLGRFPEDVTPLQQCINSAQGCLLLGLLKQYLMIVYGINNEKISKYSPSENSKLYDKQISRKGDVPCFSPSTILEKLSNNSTESNKSLVSKYLQLKSLINSLDPEDFVENPQAPSSICNNVENIEECSTDQQMLLEKPEEQKKIEKTHELKRVNHRKRKRTNTSGKKKKMSRSKDE